MKEELCIQSPEILNFVAGIKEARGNDKAKQLELAEALFTISHNYGNQDLKNYADCILGDAYYKNNDYMQAFYYLSRGIIGITDTDEYDITTIAFNELGIIYRSQGHYWKSLESFMKGIDVAREHKLFLREAIICCNLASLCDGMGAEAEAITYHYRALECCEFIEDQDYKVDLLFCEYCPLIKLLLKSNDYKTADYFFSELLNLIAKYPEYDDMFDTRLCRWYYNRENNNTEEALLYKKLSIESFYECNDFVTYMDELIGFVSLMLRDKEYEELERIINRFDSSKNSGENVNLHLHIEELKIKLYQEIGEQEKMLLASYQYYKYDSMKQEVNRKGFVTNLHLMLELNQQKTRNLFLTKAAEIDALTGLSNRAKLNRVIDELFVMANKENKSLGVEMMDVDFFKSVNDKHGHAKGDELLTEMGKAFKELSNDKIFFARYGGDEFVVYYYDMTDEEILEFAKLIKQQMIVIGRKLGLGDLTVSQGVVNRVPQPLNRAWDYLNSADYALYYIKGKGRDGAALIHNRKDLDHNECKVV